MDDTLDPCPFCEGLGIFWDRGGMECPACAARGPANEKQRVCVTAWNTRPAEDASQDDWLRAARMEALEAEVRRLQFVEDALTASQAEVGRLTRICRQLDAVSDDFSVQIDQLRIGIEHLLMSADCTWEERGEGHDWREAVQEARALLTPPAAPEADTPR